MTVFIVLMETLEENSPSFSKKGENYQSEGMKNDLFQKHFLVPIEFVLFWFLEIYIAYRCRRDYWVVHYFWIRCSDSLHGYIFKCT